MELDFDNFSWTSMFADTYNMKPKQDPRVVFKNVFNFKEYYEELNEVDVVKFLRFIPMAYDKNSPLRSHFTESTRLKIKAADLAGFVRQDDGRFLSNVENVLNGGNEIANRMIIRYVVQHKNSLYTRFVMYQELYENEMNKLRSGEKGAAKISEFDTLGDKLDEIRQELFSQDNNIKLQNDFHQFYFEDKLLLRPEDIAEKLRKGEPAVAVPQKKKIQNVNKKILQTYLKEDEYVIINIDDDLHPVHIKLPACEDITQAQGYGLSRNDQKFTKIEMPKKITHLLNTTDKIEEVWATISANQVEYTKEIKWIEEQWYYCLNGFWFYNRGRLTYLDGWHYNYLNFWRFSGGVIPEYRDRDRKWFHAVRYAYATTEYPSLDKDGRVEYTNKETRLLKMQDAHRKVFLGYSDPKGRRAGDSNKHLCAQYFETITNFGKNSGIISSSGGHAKDKLFDEILVAGWQQMPFFLRPITSSNENPEKELKFNAGRKKADSSKVQDQLKSKIDHSPTAAANYYDGGKLFWLLADEGGKCFGKDTKIRMYNGTIKNVQDIENGEYVMGDDSGARLVYGVTKGTEEMFKIIPNKGHGFICNKSHILTLSVSDRIYINGEKYLPGDILNISVKDYLINVTNKKAVALYRKGYEQPEKNHLIDPYLLGVWLGDGTKKSFAITSIDKEILSALEYYANKYGLYLKQETKITFRLSSKSRKNPLTKELRRLNIYNEKDIPLEYLRDSIQNRLLLLAGIIDTDGYYDSKGFEITQKSKKLAFSIYDLAISSGFYANIRPKEATMKRSDGTTYRCIVYRINIYGDIDKIPTKIKRKQAKVSRTKNRRNPLKTGFKIESIGDGDYYGFAVDKNNLFLLADGTVVHNTKDVDVYERHQQLKQCVAQGAGINIIGFMGLPSTVGEMEGSGGRAYYNICKDSKFEERNLSGQTITGLMLIFISCLEGLEGFVDEYGYSVVDTPTAEQAKFIGKTYGALDFVKSTRESLLKDPKDIEKYNEFVRLFPIKFKECFRTSDGDIGFNTKIINERLDELAIIGNELTRVGNFKWEKEKYNSLVVWEDNPKGKWTLSQILPPNVSCKFTWVNIDGVPQRQPHNPKHVTCCDPYKQEKVNTGRMSDGGIATAYDFDPSVDSKSDNPETWKSYRLVCTYRNRPGTTDDFYDDVLLEIVYFNSWLYPEINIPDIIRFMQEKGFAGYFLYDFDWKTGRLRNTPGFSSQGSEKQNLFNTTRNYIQIHGHKERHADFLKECKDIQSMEEMTDYDLFTAGAGALKGCMSVMSQRQQNNNVVVKRPNLLKKRTYAN